MNGVVSWLDRPFEVCIFNGLWRDVGGVYIFTGLDPQHGWWEPFYVGETGSFRSRMLQHRTDKWIEAVRLGATHVHALEVPQEALRLNMERELIDAYNPPLNVQLRSRPSFPDLYRPLS
jgi:excinuclease UvrABC nuclease subunit